MTTFSKTASDPATPPSEESVLGRFSAYRLSNGLVVPNLIVGLAGLILAGVMFAWIYVSSGNLWFMIGVHALINAPSVVVASPLDGNLPPVILVGVLVPLLVPRLRRRRASRVRAI